MRVLGWLGLACIATAYAIGAIHLSFTGDASIQLLVLHGIAAALLMAALIVLRLGIPSQIRAWQLRRALRPRSRPARST